MPRRTVLDAGAAAVARDAAMDRVSSAADPAWIANATQWVRYLALNRPTFTSDDVWANIPKIPESRALGPVFAALAREGFIEQVGFVKSAQVSRHKAPIAVWKLKK